ncbi:Alpha/Beta hydrolase protein [Aspergillus ambiguus]|uniref:alpha/beta hydrolase n=1 Tax=Aspergillus ambiguus TaxID=176160 RepID=UPI003CCCAEE6
MADFSEYTGPSAEWVALEATLPPDPNLGLDELKAASNKLREEAAAKAMVDEGLNTQVVIRDYAIPTRDGQTIEACTYRPSTLPASQRLPVFIYLHGGGFLFGTLRSEDATCSRIVAPLASSGQPVVVVNVNYRHTPEHVYPTAWNDVEDAFHWVHEHLDEIGGDGKNVVVGGISAGAWLTASLTLAQHLGKDVSLAKRPQIRGQILMIPCVLFTGHNGNNIAKLRDPSVSSYVQNEHAPILPVSRAKLFSSLLKVSGGKELEEDRRLSPGNATADEVKGLPPATFGIAGRDPLRDEGLFYAQLLSENGVPTDVNVFSGLPHGFRRYGNKLSESKRWDSVVCEGIKWTLSNPVANKFVVKVE